VHIPGAATLFVKFDPRYATGQIAVTFNVMFYRIINPKHTFLRDFVGYADAFTDNVDDDSFFFVLFCFVFTSLSTVCIQSLIDNLIPKYFFYSSH